MPGFAVYESDDEYNSIASDVVLAADRDPPVDRDPPEASGPSEDGYLPEDRDPSDASGPSEDRNLPEDRNPPDASGHSEDRDLPEARGGPSENRNSTEDRDSTNDGASTSRILDSANGRRRAILFMKGDRCNDVSSCNTVTKKYERKSSSPKKPRVGVPWLQSKIARFLK